MKKRSFALLALLLVVPLMFALIGCGDDDDAAGTAPLAIGIEVDYNGNVGEGMTSQLQAWGIYKNGDIKNITNTASWSSVVKDAATVTGKGLVTGVAPGKTAVIANLNGTKASVQITVASIDAVIIRSSEGTEVTDLAEEVVTDSARQLSAEASVNGIPMDVTEAATWTSSLVANVTVADGLVTGITTDGVSNIVAAIGNKTGAVEVTSVASPATLFITASLSDTAVMYKGTTRQFDAEATTAGGSGDTYDVTDYVTWDSATVATATIDATGLVTAVSTTGGDATDITAALGTTPVTSTATNLEIDDVVDTVTVTPANPEMLVGSTKAMTATGTVTHSDGTTYTFDATTLATWESLTTTVATVGASTGIVTGIKNGTSVLSATSDITATLDDVGTSTVTVIAVPTVHSVAIEYSAEAGGGTIINMPAGVAGPGAFTVTAIYNSNDGAALPGTGVDVTGMATFTSDATGVATVISFPDTDASDEDFNGWVFLKKVGLANVTASVDGVSSTTGVLAYVEETTKLDITPLTASTTLGTMVSTDTWLSATATIASGATMEVGCNVAWSSDNKVAANMSAASINDTCGMGLSTAAGTANVSAKFNGVKSTADAVITAN